MPLQTKKLLFAVFYLGLIFTGPITVVNNTPFSILSGDTVSIANFIQRITGLLLFTLLFIQIMLGSFMNIWTQIIGSKAYWIHITQGIAIYMLALFHPLMEMTISYNISGSLIDALSVLLPKINNQREIYLLYAKLALILLTLSVGAAYFRTKPLFRKHWLKFHFLNYAIFYLIYLHMRVGSDITTPPFVWVSWVALVLVTVSIILRIYNSFRFKILTETNN